MAAFHTNKRQGEDLEEFIATDRLGQHLQQHSATTGDVTTFNISGLGGPVSTRGARKAPSPAQAVIGGSAHDLDPNEG